MQKWMFAIALFVAFAAPALIGATPQSGERKSTVEPKLVIERFAANELERGLLIPVEVNGASLQFMLSTSDLGSTVDKSIDVGSVSSHRFMDAPGGALKRVDLYDMPPSSIGKVDLQQDISVVQQQSLKFEYLSAGYEYHGVLGCDFFRQHVVQINFDQRELLILTDAPPDCGKSFELGCDSTGIPSVTIDLGGVTEDFSINTANVTFESGCICEELIRPLLEQGRARQVGATLAATVDGQALTGVYQLDQVALGRFNVRDAMFRVGPKNSISLKFLSRFLVTIDLANQRIYLNPGKQFEQTDLYNRSGLSVCWHEDQMIVVNVESFSPASEADLRRGDILLRVGNVETAQLSLHSVQRMVRAEKDALPVVVHRGASEVLETVLHLAPAFGEPLAAATTAEQRPTR